VTGGEGRANVRLVAALLLLGALYGCGAGGFIPNGPHAMDSAALQALVADGARQSKLSPQLIAAMINVESHGDPSAISRSGAEGLMQLMPDTAATYGVSNAFDPRQNVAGGCRYMRELLRRYHHDVARALAAYNAGPGAVDAANGIPAYVETRAYVARITAALHSATN